MSYTIYGISTCDSCRKAKKWFTSHNIDFTWVDTRKAPPSQEQISTWVNKLGNKVMRNTSGGAYRALGENKKTWTDEQWIAAFTKDPMLLKRPLIEQNGIALSTGFKGSDEEIKKRLNIE